MNNRQKIIGSPHHQSEHRAHMTLYDRAAQFAPFAALTGYDAALRETARLTDRKIELDEDAKEQLDRTLEILLRNIASEPSITVTYFVPDTKKDGGKYITVDRQLKKLDNIYHRMIFTDGTQIHADDILTIQAGEHDD